MTGNGPLDTVDECNDVSTSISESGEFLYTYHAIDNHGCEYTQDVIVEVSEITATAPEDFTICPEQTIDVDGEVTFSGGSFGDMVYQWSPADFLNATNTQDVEVSDVTATTEYTFSAFPNGIPECTSSDVITITPIPGPVAEIEVSPWCPDEAATLTALNVNLLDSVNWIDNATNEVITNLPATTVDMGGDYTLIGYGCGITDEATVNVEEQSCFVIAPNVFSPDGDGNDMNTTFHIIGLENRAGSHLIVFSRWGNKVYEDTNYSNDWSPTRDEANDGVYFWTLRLLDGTEMQGTITILREK